MTNTGVGIIGGSPKPASWAAIAHIPALRAVPGLRLRAVATSRRASADAAAAAYGVDGFDDPRALIDHPGVDLAQARELTESAASAGVRTSSDCSPGLPRPCLA